MSIFNYHNKNFAPISNSENGEVSGQTIFRYEQTGQIVTASYFGGKIQKGHLIGWVDEKGNIDMHYHHINDEGEIMTGICHSKPEVLKNGKIRLHEKWKWTSGNQSEGYSIIEEQ